MIKIDVKKELHYLHTFFSSRIGIFLLGSLIGFVIFCILFDIRVVSPTNTNWILNIHGDIVQHYLGWLYYRDSPWNFPNIGHIDSLASPSGISIVFMDVIPVFAIFFKIFSFLLPEQFQYLGLFTLISFILQGGIAALIFRRFTTKISIVLVGALLVTATPLIISRSFAHTALSAHWLVLLAIYFMIIFQQTPTRLRKQIVAWSVVMGLAVLTHAYFVPIVGFIFILSVVLQFKTIRQSAILVLIPAICMLTLFTLIGGFSPGMDTGGGTSLGLYSLNALGPFIPMGYSYFLNASFHKVQWEGLAYLGLGVILLIPVVWYLFVDTTLKSKREIKKLWKKIATPRSLIIILGFIALYIAALGPIIFIGDWNIFTLPLPSIVERLWSVFRSTGRLFWPIYYLLIIGLIVYVILRTQKWKWWITLVFLAPFVLLQTLDVLFSHEASSKGSRVETSLSTHTNNELNAAFIEKYCSKETLVLVDNSIESGIKLFEDLSGYIVQCQPTLTAGYFARFPRESILQYAEEKRQGLIDGSLSLDDTSLYVSQSREFISEISPRYHAIKLGDYWIIKE